MKIKKASFVVALFLSLYLIMPLHVHAATGLHVFDDTLDHWAQYMISWSYEEGLFSGTSETSFSPNAEMSRGMAVTVLYRLSGEKASGKHFTFEDVAKDAYYSEAVAWASENSIVTGSSETTFGPGLPIKRQDFVTMLYRYNQGNHTYEISNEGEPLFSDEDQISEYAKQAMYWGIENKIVNGDNHGRIRPQDPILRSQAATVLFHYDSINHPELYELDFTNIDKIIIQSGDGPRAFLTPDQWEDEMNRIVEELNNFGYVRKEAFPVMGWSCSIAVYEKEIADPVVSAVIGPSFIRTGAICYISNEDSYFDLNWYREIIEQ